MTPTQPASSTRIYLRTQAAKHAELRHSLRGLTRKQKREARKRAAVSRGRGMTTFADVIRAAIPAADDGVLDHVLWGRTPFPMGRVTARSLFKAASTWGRACNHNIVLCDQCDNPVATGRKFFCDRCATLLEGVIHDPRHPHNTEPA